MRKRVSSLQELIDRLQDEGWKVTYTGGGHLKMRSPTGAVVFTGSSPSDRRSIRNTVRDLKRAGWSER